MEILQSRTETSMPIFRDWKGAVDNSGLAIIGPESEPRESSRERYRLLSTANRLHASSAKLRANSVSGEQNHHQMLTGIKIESKTVPSRREKSRTANGPPYTSWGW